MMRSLRSRLIAGMLLGMIVLLLAADAIIYTVQRRQLFHAFDETLLGSANALALLVHPGPFGEWFDTDGLARLPAGEIRAGALYQLWSDQPLNLPMPRTHPDGDSAALGPPPPPPDHDFREPHPSRLSEWQRLNPHHPGGRPPSEPSLEDPFPPRRRPSDPPRRPWSSELVIRSENLGGLDLPRLDTAPGQPRFERIALPDGRLLRAVGVQFRAPAPPANFRPVVPRASLTAVVAASTAEIDKSLTFLAAVLAATAFGAMALAAGVAWLVVSRGLRPFATIARAIAGMDENDLKQRIVQRETPREIAPVIHQLNALLARLDEAFERERTLTADVAHELRTPVAEIRAIAEITLSRLREPQEYRQALGETLETVTDLQALIEKLLVLARLEAGQMKPELAPVPLRLHLEKCWGEVGRSQAAARHQSIEIACSPDALVAADPKLLEIVLSNALSNAAAYSPDGGRITVAAEANDASWQVSITNPGCELTADDVHKVFDRFWRADAARSAGALNCGLGLTLVRRAMQAVGGGAAAHVSAEGNFVLVLTFQRGELRDEPATGSTAAAVSC